MKYQIILENLSIEDDQSFNDWAHRALNHLNECDEIIPHDYTIVEARSLDGIREEVWKRKEELKEQIGKALESVDEDKAVDQAFDDLSDLFKLN